MSLFVIVIPKPTDKIVTPDFTKNLGARRSASFDDDKRVFLQLFHLYS